MMIPSEGELFKKILGREWGKLHPDIQARFDKNPLPGKPLYYTGHLSELTCSRVGRVLGYLSMPFVKGALMPYNDCLLYTSPSPRDRTRSRMPSSA